MQKHNTKTYVKPYFSQKHKRTSYAVGVNGTSVKLFLSYEDMLRLREQLDEAIRNRD